MPRTLGTELWRDAFRPLLRAGDRFARDAANRPILMFEDVYKSYRPGAPVLRGMNLDHRARRVRVHHRAERRRASPRCCASLARREAGRGAHPLPGSRHRAAPRGVGPVPAPQHRRRLPGLQARALVDACSRTSPSRSRCSACRTRLVRSRVGEALERVGLPGRGGDPARRALRRRAAARRRSRAPSSASRRSSSRTSPPATSIRSSRSTSSASSRRSTRPAPPCSSRRTIARCSTCARAASSSSTTARPSTCPSGVARSRGRVTTTQLARL